MSNKRPRPTLSLVTMVKNEEEALPRCLDSLKGVVDGMIIVDTGSTDDTKAIAGSYGARVIDCAWTGDFSAPRNAGLKVASTDWIIQLDADEELVAGEETLADLLKDKYVQGYYTRIATWDGKVGPISEATTSFMAIRLFRRIEGLYYKYPIHEQIIIEDADREARSAMVINHFGPAMGRTAESKTSRNLPILQEAIGRYPDDAYYHAMIGNEYFAIRDFRSAVPHYEKALDLVGRAKSWSPAVIRNLAWCTAQNGQPAAAVAILGNARKQYADYTDLYLVEAYCLAEMGNSVEAERLFRQCLAMGDPPDHYISFGGTGGWRAQKGLDRLLSGNH